LISIRRTRNYILFDAYYWVQGYGYGKNWDRRFSVWLLSGYSHVLVLFSIVFELFPLDGLPPPSPKPNLQPPRRGGGVVTTAEIDFIPLAEHIDSWHTSRQM